MALLEVGDRSSVQEVLPSVLKIYNLSSYSELERATVLLGGSPYFYPWRNPSNNIPYAEETSTLWKRNQNKQTALGARRLLQYCPFLDKNFRNIWGTFWYLNFCFMIYLFIHSFQVFSRNPQWHSTEPGRVTLLWALSKRRAFFITYGLSATLQNFCFKLSKKKVTFSWIVYQ